MCSEEEDRTDGAHGSGQTTTRGVAGPSCLFTSTGVDNQSQPVITRPMYYDRARAMRPSCELAVIAITRQPDGIIRPAAERLAAFEQVFVVVNAARSAASAS